MSWRHIGAIEVYLYSLFNLRAKWRWVVNTTLRLLYPGNDPNPMYMRLSGSRAILDGCETSRPPPGFDRRNVASRYTSYIIPAPCWFRRIVLSHRRVCQSVLNYIRNMTSSGLEVGWGSCATRPFDCMIRALRPGVDPKVARSNHGLILRLFLWFPATVQFTRTCPWWWYRSPNRLLLQENDILLHNLQASTSRHAYLKAINL
jgi:hypothetical protein